SAFSPTAPPASAIYPLSLHDALPIYRAFPDRDVLRRGLSAVGETKPRFQHPIRREVCNVDLFDGEIGPKLAFSGEASDCDRLVRDRKSTRLNSSHVKISYAVFCLKKK